MWSAFWLKAIFLVPAASWQPHVIGLVSTLSFYSLTAVVKQTLAGGLQCPHHFGAQSCDLNVLPIWDRVALIHHHRYWAQISDAGEIVGLALPTLLLGTEWLINGDQKLLKDWLILHETMAVAGLLTQLLKLAIRRPRPDMYRDEAGQRSIEGLLSFPSGHTVGVATAVAAVSSHFWHRYPHHPWRWLMVATGGALIGITAGGRVLGGAHFPTDTLAGGIMGIGLGLLGSQLAFDSLN